MAGFQSDFERFQEEMRARHPEWEEEQREGLALLWNKKVNFAELKTFSSADERPHSYPYDVNFEDV